jgi:hypothetical protein
VTYLLDTNILSETRKREPTPSVAAWIAATPAAQLHVSVLTLGEIQQGIERIRGNGDWKQATALEGWLMGLEARFDTRVLPVTLMVASAWGRQQQGRPIPVIDALIAATARVHDMTIVTRNVRDFEQTGVLVLNPFEAA